jgi:cytochrome o ubiquinol oxidase subunit 2
LSDLISDAGIFRTGVETFSGLILPAGPIAAAEQSHFHMIVALMALVIAPPLIGLPIILWRYRLSRPIGKYRPDWSFSLPLEILMWGAPTLVVCALAVTAWRSTIKLDPYRQLAQNEPPLRVQAIALDWKWLFLYPDANIAAADYLAIQAGRPVSIEITSATVMQSFMIPRLGGQIYAMGGMVTQLNLEAAHAGEFMGMNTQYNGVGFAKQFFPVVAMDEPDYRAFVEKAKSAPPLDEAAYSGLTKKSAPHKMFFGSIPESFFSSIVARRMDGEATLCGPAYAGNEGR